MNRGVSLAASAHPPRYETMVAASLWSVPREALDHHAQRLTAAGLQRWHWDVSDGGFAAPGGFTVDDVARLTALTGLPGEAHLMVSQPLSTVDEWADICDTVVVHVETYRWRDAVERIRSRGRRAGVAVSPATPLDDLVNLDPEIAVLVMAITPGQAGSTFLPTTLDRLDRLRGRPTLGVDGGVSRSLAHDCVAHGATWIVSGSDLCGTANPAKWIRDIKATQG